MCSFFEFFLFFLTSQYDTILHYTIRRYTVTFALICETPSKYCIEYINGTLHDVWTFELITLVSVVAAIVGYLRAAHLYQSENSSDRHTSRGGEEDDFSPLAQTTTDSNHENDDEANELLRRNEIGVS